MMKFNINKLVLTLMLSANSISIISVYKLAVDNDKEKKYSEGDFTYTHNKKTGSYYFEDSAEHSAGAGTLPSFMFISKEDFDHIEQEAKK